MREVLQILIPIFENISLLFLHDCYLSFFPAYCTTLTYTYMPFKIFLNTAHKNLKHTHQILVTTNIFVM